MDKEDKTIKTLWNEEIIRETEHFYQGEIQQEQRASWLLATSSLLLTGIISYQIPSNNNEWKFSIGLTSASIILLSISALISIITIIPFRGTKFFSEPIGYRLYKITNSKANLILEESFHTKNFHSLDDYNRRIKYHYINHYKRNLTKSYGIIWTTLFLSAGIILSVINVMITIAK